MATRCTEVHEWQTGHSPFIGQPDLIVELLESYTRRRAGQ
ncbi:hypothetical protein QF037_008815 [Streptomyces canus]|nr:hypothetical protein [Streptomyces canus]